MKYKYICISSFSSSMEISPSRSTLSEGEKGTKRFYWLKQGSSSSRSHYSSGTFSVSCDSWHEKKRLWQWEDSTKGQTNTAYNGIWNSYKVSRLNQDLTGIFMILAFTILNHPLSSSQSKCWANNILVVFWPGLQLQFMISWDTNTRTVG